MSNLTYADHDVHWCKHKVTWSQAAGAGPITDFQSVEEFDVTLRGLDPDELAELRGLHISAVAHHEPGNNVQDEVGGIVGLIGAGFNLVGDEFIDATPYPDGITGASGTSETGVDLDGSAPDDYDSVVRETDEVGQLVSDRVAAGLGFREAGDSLGGGATPTVLNRYIDLAGSFGTGPVVDAADNFSSSISFEVGNVVADATVDVTYGLYYAVETSEGGRTRFGR